MLKKPGFVTALNVIFSGKVLLEKTTDAQLQKEAETLVRKLVTRELKAAKTKADRLVSLSSSFGKPTLNSVLEGLSQRDAATLLKRCDPGAPELELGKQAELVSRLKRVADGAELHPAPNKAQKKKSTAKPKAKKAPTFEALSLEGRKKR